MQSKDASEPANMGEPPASRSAQSTPSNRATARDANLPAAGCCPIWLTLTANFPAFSNVSRLAEVLASENKINGGSSDTDVKLLAVNPMGSLSAFIVVTIVTPVAKQPKASRRMRASEPAMKVSGARGACRSRKSIRIALKSSSRSDAA